MTTRTPHTGVAGEVFTAANLAKYPKGWIGFVEASLSQTNITTEEDLTGVTVTVTVGSDRCLKINGAVEVAGDGAGDNCRLKLYRDVTMVVSCDLEVDTTRQTITLPPVIDNALAAGSYTYKLAMLRVTGSGNLDVGFAGHPATLVVEDIGPAS